MSNSILISIITINYNDKVGLERTIKSIVNQTNKNFEYIVIDGNSSDGSKEVIEDYKDRIDLCVSEPDKGIYNAMNKGINNANGDYLLFINSGDELYNTNVLEENIAELHSEDLIYFDLLQVFKDKTNLHRFPDEINNNTFLKGTIGHPTTFIKKDLFHKIGLYDETLNIVADWKFFSLAFIKHNCSTRHVNKVLSKFYMDGVSTINNEKTKQERQKVIEENFSDYVRLNELENFAITVKNAKSIRFLRNLGILKFIDKI
ncbi:glycosyltransferase [Vicingus serpentipes]|uniref:Glycosyltransferase n=1 Tax=Vicingus serpentipes TaxID=1926625 RepID=A0A5C6RSU2_9FLAO|nr:glycosyltransferase family 2 protein [Vicingus serpentipes]TXB65411.1 glycosyltransferase [Vicingus serpentipes]